MTVTISGNTFQHRERLKQLGGRWENGTKIWRFDYGLRAAELAELKNLPFCVVTEDGPNTPPPYQPTPRKHDTVEDATDWIRAILDAEPEERPTTGEGGTVIYGDDQRYLNYFKDKNPKAFFGFSSLGAMVDFVEAIPEHKRRNSSSGGYGRSDIEWSGTPSMDAAIRLARNGWQQGVDDAAAIMETMNLEHALQRRRAFSVAGGAVSVGRMLAGNPKHMIRRPKQPGRRVITLFVDNGISAFVDAESLTVRAAVIGAIADMLESNGYSCEIVTLCNVVDRGRPAQQTAVTLKHAGEKLNIADVVFALGHPSFLRRLIFACVCQAPELRSIYESQGAPGDAFNKHYEPGKNEFHIKKLSRRVDCDDLIEAAHEMLPLVKPENLPLEIE